MKTIINITQSKCHGKCLDSSSFTIYCKYGRWLERGRAGLRALHMEVWCDKFKGWIGDIKGLR